MTDRAARSSIPAGNNGSWGWWVLGIVGALLAAYANSFPGAFFFDDDAAILQNASIRHLLNWRVLWPPVEAGIGGRPFANLTFAVNYALAGYNPGSYHAVNLAIHLAGAVVLFALVRRTLLLPAMRTRYAAHATWLAGVVALAWALNPVQTNIVDYMSQRTEGLMALLYLITLYAYARSVAPAPDLAAPERRQALRWAVLAVVACGLGMATKEDMVTAPFIVWLYDRTFVSGSFLAALRDHGGRLAALAATWIALGALMATSSLGSRGVGFHLDRDAFSYALTECRSILTYLHVAVWPHPLIFDYGTDFYLSNVVAALPFAIPLALLLGATLFLLWRRPPAGFALTWFFVLLAPSSSVIPVAPQPCAENRVYLPLAGIAALLVVGFFRYAGRRSLPLLTLGALALGVATYARNPVFRSELAIWTNTVAERPSNPRAQNNLGNSLLKNGRAEAAMPYFETAIRLSPTYADAHNNRGVVLLEQHKPKEALAEFERAVELKKNYADAYYNIGEANLALHQDAAAVEPLQRSLAINPNNPKAHNNLGIALLDLGHVDESIEHERRAIALNPDLSEAHYNLANSLARAGQAGEALAEYDATLRINPKFARAHNNAGVILLNQGKRDDARARFEAALRIDPNYPEAKSNLALVQPSTQTASARP